MKRILVYILICALIGGLLVCPAFAEGPFPDVGEEAPYAEAVEYLKNAGIMQGDNMGHFNPNQTITRAEMAAIVCRMLGETENMSISNVFSDVSTTHWANGYISRAAELKIVRGYGNGVFGPSDLVTYEQAITMLVRTVGMESQANQLGGYPNGYIAVAQNIGMLFNVSAESGRYMHRSEIATMAFNCRSAWDTASVSGQMTDGKYSVRISVDKLKKDQAGNELIYAEILEPVVLTDSFVSSLKVGDKIMFQNIWDSGQAYEIEVSMLDKSDDDIWISENAWLSQYKSGWMIFENILPVEYVAELRELQLSTDTTIIDGATSLAESGTYEVREYKNLQAFFDRCESNATEWSAIVTIASGNVVEVYIQYRPV